MKQTKDHNWQLANETLDNVLQSALEISNGFPTLDEKSQFVALWRASNERIADQPNIAGAVMAVAMLRCMKLDGFGKVGVRA